MSISKNIRHLLEGKKFKLPAGDWVRDELDVEEIKKDKEYKVNGIKIWFKKSGKDIWKIMSDDGQQGNLFKMGNKDFVATSDIGGGGDRDGTTPIEAAAQYLANIGSV